MPLGADAFLNDVRTWGRSWSFLDPPAYGWGQYMAAARHNNTHMLQRLLSRTKSKQEVGVVGLDGRSALHVIALFGDFVEAGNMLLKAGEDPSIQTRLGEDSLQYAEKFGRPQLAAMLRSALMSRLSQNKSRGHGKPLTRELLRSVKSPRRRYSATPPAPPRQADFRSSTQRCCLHSCNGRGKCRAGACQCHRNGTGFDCNGFLPPTAPARCPLGRRHGIYIGAHGLQVSGATLTEVRQHWVSLARDCARQAVATVAPTTHGIYSPLDMFLLRLLNDESVRAPSVNCAQAVWHPTFGVRLYGNTEEELKWRIKGRISGLRSDAYMQELPHVELPHVHEEHQDVGSCGSPTGLLWPGDVVLSYWGLADCHPPDTTMIVVPPGVRHSPKLRRSDAKWTVVDPELVGIATKAYAPHRIHAPRKRQLFFRGATREDKVPPPVAAACLKLNRSADDRRCIDGLYSLGVRQVVKALIGQHPIVSFNEIQPKGNGSYRHNLLNSEFCLTSPGMGFGVRVVDYVAAGCIPVVVRPGRLRMPLEPDLDYSTFGVTIPFHDIPKLPRLLESMSADEIRSKRERLRDVHKKFIWDEHYGSAYETVRGLLLRALQSS
jgi:hypothetical protein